MSKNVFQEVTEHDFELKTHENLIFPDGRQIPYPSLLFMSLSIPVSSYQCSGRIYSLEDTFSWNQYKGV